VLSINQEELEAIIKLVEAEIDSSPEEEIASLVDNKKKKIDAIKRSMKQAAAAGCRRNLTGRDFKGPFDLLMETLKIIDEARLTTIASLKGIPLGPMDTVREALSKKLLAELAKIESASLFASRMGVTDLAEVAIREKIKSRQHVDGSTLLKLVHQLAKEKSKKAQIDMFTKEDSEKLNNLVRSGKIYKFESKILEKALNTFYDTGNGEQIMKALQGLASSRR